MHKLALVLSSRHKVKLMSAKWREGPRGGALQDERHCPPMVPRGICWPACGILCQCFSWASPGALSYSSTPSNRTCHSSSTICTNSCSAWAFLAGRSNQWHCRWHPIPYWCLRSDPNISSQEEETEAEPIPSCFCDNPAVKFWEWVQGVCVFCPAAMDRWLHTIQQHLA